MGSKEFWGKGLQRGFLSNGLIFKIILSPMNTHQKIPVEETFLE